MHSSKFVENLPKYVDLNRFDSSEEKFRIYKAASNEWPKAFNSGTEFGVFVSYLKDDFKIDIAIETGTSLGTTTQYFAKTFPEVYTIDIDTMYYEKALIDFKKTSNVRCYLGDSGTVLREILPSVQGKMVFFYLDAHSKGIPWPLLKELEAIAITHKDNSILLIDDFKVPGHPEFGYDGYEGNDCCLEYIQNRLDKAFTNYSYHYLLPKSQESKAKLLALPR